MHNARGHKHVSEATAAQTPKRCACLKRSPTFFVYVESLVSKTYTGLAAESGAFKINHQLANPANDDCGFDASFNKLVP